MDASQSSKVNRSRPVKSDRSSVVSALAFGDVPIKKVPPVLSGWISMGFEKLRSAYPELDPPLEPVGQITFLVSAN